MNCDICCGLVSMGRMVPGWPIGTLAPPLFSFLS